MNPILRGGDLATTLGGLALFGHSRAKCPALPHRKQATAGPTRACAGRSGECGGRGPKWSIRTPSSRAGWGGVLWGGHPVSLLSLLNLPEGNWSGPVYCPLTIQDVFEYLQGLGDGTWLAFQGDCRGGLLPTTL